MSILSRQEAEWEYQKQPGMKEGRSALLCYSETIASGRMASQ